MHKIGLRRKEVVEDVVGEEGGEEAVDEEGGGVGVFGGEKDEREA